MKKFKFRLEKIKEFRENETKEAQRELARCIQRLTQAENNLSDLKAERDRIKTQADTILTAGQLSMVSEYEQFIQTLLRQQVETIQEAEIAVENAREALIERAHSEKALSLLREKRHDEFIEEKKRQDRKQISNIALRQYKMSEHTDGE